MSNRSSDGVEELPIAETEEIDLPTSGGSAYGEGLVTTHLVGGETTLALLLRGDDVDLTVEHEADGLQFGTTATLSTEDLRTLGKKIDAVLETRPDGGTEVTDATPNPNKVESLAPPDEPEEGREHE